MTNLDKKSIAEQTARMYLETGAVRFMEDKPFIFTSGWASPVYNDSRWLISFPNVRATLMDFAVATIDRDIGRDKIDTVFETLSYFDGVNFAARANAPALFSTALMDETCPPSTVFAAYNHYNAPKDIHVWPYNNHEGGETFQTVEKLKFLRGLFG